MMSPTKVNPSLCKLISSVPVIWFQLVLDTNATHNLTSDLSNLKINAKEYSGYDQTRIGNDTSLTSLTMAHLNFPQIIQNLLLQLIPFSNFILFFWRIEQRGTFYYMGWVRMSFTPFLLPIRILIQLRLLESEPRFPNGTLGWIIQLLKFFIESYLNFLSLYFLPSLDFHVLHVLVLKVDICHFLSNIVMPLHHWN